MSESQPSLPPLFKKRLHQIIPTDQWETSWQSFSVEKPTAFRVNTLKATVTQTKADLMAQGFDLTAVSWSPTAFYVPALQRRQLTETALFQKGHIYIQNLSSMLAPLILNPQPNELILDLAAAPGSKTTQMAAMMANEGQISAVEPVKNRFFRLLANLEQQGVTIAKTYRKDGRAVGRQCPNMFDRVLLDAPCSSEARITQREPKSWAHWRPHKIKETAHKQKRLLQSALLSLKPGGTLLYCTCAFAPEENEAVINALLKKHNDTIQIHPINLPLTNTQSGLTTWKDRHFHPDLAHSLRILPTAEMDGFYLCKLIKQTTS